MSGNARQQAEREGERLSRRPDLAERVADRARERMRRYGDRLGGAVDELRSLVRLVKAWASGEYRQVPLRSIAAAIGALVYFLMPLDAIPDFIFAFGFLDDAAVISQVVYFIRRDLAAFRDWEESTGKGPGDDG